MALWATSDDLKKLRVQIEAAIAASNRDIISAIANAKQELLTAISTISVPSSSSAYAMTGGTKFSTLQEAADAVVPGGIVEISGELKNEAASAAFTKSCEIIGKNAAKLTWTLGTTVRMAWGKGLIVCSGNGNSFSVKNIELSGAKVTDRNGAGVRCDPGVTSLTVSDCNIHDNENAVLSAAKTQIFVNNTVKNNGNSAGSSHNFYIQDGCDLVTFENNKIYAAIVGNQIKSRAKNTVIRRNVIAELDGSCSWQIDIPIGGIVLVENNVIEQGPNSQNWNLMSYAPEGLMTPPGNITFKNNILINDFVDGGCAVNIFRFPEWALWTNNIFIGKYEPLIQSPIEQVLDSSNKIFADRVAAGLSAYPFLPTLPV